MYLLTCLFRCPGSYQMLVFSAVIWQVPEFVVPVVSLCCSPETVLGIRRSNVSVLLALAPPLSVMSAGVALLCCN